MSTILDDFIGSITLTDIVQGVVLIIVFARMWFVVENRSHQTQQGLSEVRGEVKILEGRVGLVELEGARNAERHEKIMTLLMSIDTRLARLEDRR